MPLTIGRAASLRMVPAKWVEPGPAHDPTSPRALPRPGGPHARGGSPLVFPDGYLPGHSAAILNLYAEMGALVRGQTGHVGTCEHDASGSHAYRRLSQRRRVCGAVRPARCRH